MPVSFMLWFINDLCQPQVKDRSRPILQDKPGHSVRVVRIPMIHDFDRFSQLEAYMDYVEQCAESGFRVVEKKLEECGDDNDLLERRMLKELDLLYTSVVENDI